MKIDRRSLSLFLSMIMICSLTGFFPVKAATSAELSISQNGVEFICSMESFHSTCYSDNTQSSIGFGTKCTDSSVQPHQAGLHSITREQALNEMMSQINNRYAPIVRRQTSGIQMNQNQFDALVSLCYNTGGGNTIISDSPLVNYLKGNISESEARSQYSQYIVMKGTIYETGLRNRRNSEANLFFSGNQPISTDTELDINYPRPTGSPLLKNGSKGSGVNWLQTALNKANNAGLAVDGDFGSGTKQAVINFQKANGLDADGIAGPATINKLVEVIKNKLNPIAPPEAPNVTITIDYDYNYMVFEFNKQENVDRYMAELGIVNGDVIIRNSNLDNNKFKWKFEQTNAKVEHYLKITAVNNSGSSTTTKYFTILAACDSGHTYGSWTTIKSATCASEGSEKRICSVCGNSETRTISATGHLYNSKIIPPTNSEKGYTLHTCSKCGSSYKGNFTDTLVFEFIASESSVNINIDKNEKKSITFSYKNVPPSVEYVNVQIEHGDNPVVNLEWGQWENHAISLYFSGYCTGTENVTVKLYDAGTKEVLATKTIKVTVSECNHSFDSWSIIKEPTCTDAGIKSRKCTICGKTETESISATGHSWSEWKTVKDATCTENGEMTRKCSVCHAEEGVPIISTMHKYESTTIVPTYTENGYTLHKCSVCGDSYKDNYTEKLSVKPNVDLIYDKVTAMPGETVQIGLFADSHGTPIQGFDIKINFDESTMKLTNINTDSYDFGAATNISNDIGAAACYYPYENGDGWTLTAAKPIVTYTFKLSENASPGAYDINIYYSEFCLYDNSAQANVNNLKDAVTIAENSHTELHGDLNADNKLSVSDVVLLQKYLVKKTRLSNVLRNLADLNNDGTVNVFDCVILKRKILKGN